MTTRKRASKRQDELRKEYDLAALGKGIRGKYYKRAVAGSNLVLLDPELARVFPTEEAVNEALRLLADVAAKTSGSRARR